MKVIGMLGGMSWESTATYYRLINEGVKERLGGLRSAKIVLYSFDFDEIENMIKTGRWEESASVLTMAALKVQSAGAEMLIICTNTMHKVAEDIEENISIPLLHIADATAQELRKGGIRKTGLIGTKYTMEEDFYRKRLKDRYKIDVAIPGERDRDTIDRIIFDELCRGAIVEESRDEYVRIINKLSMEGSQSVILGCTEISSLVRKTDTDVKLFDTTEIHAKKAVEYSLSR